MAVLFLDVDNFKFINDTYGHDLGDEVIKKTADRIRNYQDDSLDIGRFGGDEFIIAIYDYKNIGEVVHIAQKIKDEFNQPVIIDDKRFYLSMSIGISLYPDNGYEKSDLIKKADLALYEAKEFGKNSLKLYSNELNKELEKKLLFQNALKEAFKDSEFYLNYQPYYNTRSEELSGFEALIRWKSPSLGQVSPFKLIKNAEEMGLIIDIGEWVIKEACLFAKKVNHDRMIPLTVSINISIIQLTSYDFYDYMVKTVYGLGVDPSWIVLEMTETVLMESIDKSVRLINKLKEIGFGIALDDFGTGYSSLTYLKSLPIDFVKIDQSFITSMTSSNYDKDLVKMIISISKNKGIQVVAEGVETKDEFEILRNNKCDLIQGYYYSKPLDEEIAVKKINT
jgi:diguanylate cyclase (GGDEF)-like protein